MMIAIKEVIVRKGTDIKSKFKLINWLRRVFKIKTNEEKIYSYLAKKYST